MNENNNIVVLTTLIYSQHRANISARPDLTRPIGLRRNWQVYRLILRYREIYDNDCVKNLTVVLVLRNFNALAPTFSDKTVADIAVEILVRVNANFKNNILRKTPTETDYCVQLRLTNAKKSEHPLHFKSFVVNVCIVSKLVSKNTARSAHIKLIKLIAK